MAGSAGRAEAACTHLREDADGDRGFRERHDAQGHALPRDAGRPGHRPTDRRPLPARHHRRPHARHRRLGAGARRLGPGLRAEQGHHRSGLPGGSNGTGQAGDPGPPSTDGPGRSLRDVRRCPSRAGGPAAARALVGLPGDLPGLHEPVRRPGGRYRRTARPERGRGGGCGSDLGQGLGPSRQSGVARTP